MSSTAPPIPLLVARAHPRVWVQKLVLYRTTAPADIIRSIPLRRGLNIVHGVGEGHSVGKSTLCRLLRYCLGEDRFCDNDRRGDFKLALEHGAVAAELVVGGHAWTVIRPLGGSGASKALPGASFDALIAADASAASWTSFQEAISAVITAGSDALPLASGKPIDWLDILAVCTRDQDSRLDDVLKWRPKQTLTVPDSSLVLRAVLGLLSGDEARSRLEVERLDSERSQLLKQLQQSEALARVRFADHWNRLLALQITEHSADDAWNGTIANTDGITDLLSPHQVKALDVDTFNADIADANDSVQIARIEERDASQQVTRLETARQLAEAKKSGNVQEITNALSELRRLADAGETCSMLPSLPLRDCNHVKIELNRGKVVVADTARDEREYQESITAIGKQLAPARTKLESAIKARVHADQQVAKLWDMRKQTFQRQHDLNTAATALAWSIRVRDGTEPDLAALKSSLNVVEAALDRAREVRNSHLKQARNNRGDVQALYHWIVSSMAGSAYHGKVDIDDQRIRFDLDTAHAGGGLAYRTMAVPYADFAALLRGIGGSGCHPGILIHDSPREADANEHLYHSLFRLAHLLESELTPADQEPPFQYIITTTTAPPDNMRSEPWLALTLSSEPESELLFRKQIAFARQETLLS